MRERGLKCNYIAGQGIIHVVAPVRERGLKYNFLFGFKPFSIGRSREGAWIEIN